MTFMVQVFTPNLRSDSIVLFVFYKNFVKEGSRFMVRTV